MTNENSNISGDSDFAGVDVGGSVTLLPRLAKGAMINLTGAAGRTVLLYAYTLLLARMLSVSDLGEYFLMFTIINIIGLISTVGVDAGVVRYVSMYAGEGNLGLARRMLQIGLLIGTPVGLLTAALLMVIAPQVRDLFFNGSETAIAELRIYAISIPFWVVARMYNAGSQGMQRMQYQVYSRDFGEQFSKLVLSVLAIAIGMGLTGVVWANNASIIIATILSLIFTSIVLPKSLSGSAPVREPAKQIIGYSLPLAVSYILGMVLLWADLLSMGYFRTAAEVGLYGAALRVCVAISTLVIAFATVFSPVIADLYNKKNLEALQSLLKTVTRWMFICCFPVFLLMFIFPEPIMRLFGGEFAQSGEVLMMLAVGQILNVVGGSAGFVIVMSGHSRLEMTNVCFAFVVEVILCVALIPPYGAIGAAVANTSSYAAISIMRLLELWVIMRIHAFEREFIKPLVAGTGGAVAIYMVTRLVHLNLELIRFILLAIVMIIIYIVGMLLMGLDKQDKAVLHMVKKRLARASV
ncbi:MAG: flippase [Thermoleophilia bacterium]